MSLRQSFFYQALKKACSATSLSDFLSPLTQWNSPRFWHMCVCDPFVLLTKSRAAGESVSAGTAPSVPLLPNLLLG